MTWQEHWTLLSSLVLPLVFLAIIVSGVLFGVAAARREASSDTWLYLFVFSSLGASFGITVGMSREPAVTAALPALLTFFAALCGYAFTKDGLKRLQPVLPYGMLALIATASYAMFFGSGIRSKHDQARQDFDVWFSYYKNVTMPIDRAGFMKSYGFQEAKSGAAESEDKE